ncbi:MAG: hypothetical protein II180_03200 [Proteobacteria bacterium]|nr:hypothetical protein [Pseudomonadota bacterium]
MKVNTHFNAMKKRRFAGAIEMLSFSQEVRQLVDILNSEIAAPETVVFRPISHPAGFVRLITKRRLTIAEAYIRLVSHSKGVRYVERIEALQVLMHHVWHSKNLSMPINTARVQIALMKNAVKMRGDRRAQLELMSDFARASFGHVSVIRRLLRELDLIEVPETGEELSQMNLGWDDHVHDSMTEGRKSPSQLVLDAFIKGISRITVAYYDVADPLSYEEVFLAGHILGVEVQIGIEFSVGKKCERVHYLYIPPQGHEYEALSKFLNDKADALKPFWDGLKVNAERRHATVNTLLETFNQNGLAAFNAPYTDLEALMMQPLSWDSVEHVTIKGQANRIHLGQLIYQAMRPVALKRVLYLKNLYRSLRSKAHGDSNSWEAERCFKRYEEAQLEYEELTPSLCAEKYIAPQKQVDYDSSFASEDDILPVLSGCGGYIVFIHPLSLGLQKCMDILFKYYKYLTDIEVFNLVDALQRDTTDIRRFATFLSMLNSGNLDQIAKSFEEWRLTQVTEANLKKLSDYVREKPFFMRCASDAVGWSSNIPGMGFVHESALTPKALRLLRKNGHSTLPQPVANLLGTRNAKDVSSEAVYLLSSTNFDHERRAEREKCRSMTPFRIWRYMNANLRSLILAAVGFIPTYYCLGLPYALLWFFITGFRNAIVDLIAGSGLVPKTWQLRNIDRENLCASEFFSGFSVPVLALAKYGFDQAWFHFGLSEGFLFTFIKFWCIAFTNGIYLVLHNTLRGFEKSAIRGNFFRNVFSWPLATLGSYILTPLGVPDIVQAKIWSEVVAGFIEGTVKNAKQNSLAQKALYEVYHQILSPNPLYAKIARLDILFFWSNYSQGRRALERFIHISQKTVKGETEARQAEIIKGNRAIYEAFTTEGSLEALTYVILEYYPEENLVTLTDFAGETYGGFVSWLQSKKALIASE